VNRYTLLLEVLALLWGGTSWGGLYTTTVLDMSAIDDRDRPPAHFATSFFSSR
jgi:hypothetical protein